tara:strand:- start:603 stop:1043 length:441 start_codon:yes stop_codon:yes gene_type:complete
MSYDKLSTNFKSRTPYKYNKEVIFDGTKIIATEVRWVHKDGRWQRLSQPEKVVLAEYVSHKGKEYAVVYNRGNKCFTTEVMAWGFNNTWRSSRVQHLKYGEVGKPVKDQQRAYRCQMIDALIYSGAITHILIPTTLEGDSDFFKKI